MCEGCGWHEALEKLQDRAMQDIAPGQVARIETLSEYLEKEQHLPDTVRVKVEKLLSEQGTVPNNIDPFDY